ncbi:glycosyltransferase family 2 protein [Kineococcus terrestris]|uniref:glycosyltransferase family 2 protein n=1 Tax=Kineococcus terrestris TaxID=2044856 RepID=UPI0034DB2A26
MTSPALPVTVVVATRDRAEDLRRSLPRHEAPVVLVDNGSRDGTVEVARAEGRRRREEGLPPLVVLEAGENLGAVGRNLGVGAAETPLVAFADDDSWWAPGALVRAGELFAAHPRMAVLAARLLVGPAEELDGVCDDMAAAPWGRSDDLPGPDVLGFLACGAVVRREPYLAVGGFDPVVHFAGEEERFTYDLVAAGWGLAYVDEVVAHHHPSPTRSTPEQRLRLLQRNRLLTAWMRRPVRVAARDTLRALRGPAHERGGVLDAARRMPGALRRRHLAGPEVERRLAVIGR